MSSNIQPFVWRDRPALIESLFPVQKLSVESFKERKAGAGQTLVPLGAYWKGRKPLILNKACILGCLLPATDDPKRDLEIFEMLMAMDDESFVVRWPRRRRPKEILADLHMEGIRGFFESDPPTALSDNAPVDWSKPELKDVTVSWIPSVPEEDRRRIEARLLPKTGYRKRVESAKRPEEVSETGHDHIWRAVNSYLQTDAQSLPELIGQMGLMRFGHTPRLADVFSGSGQIPFEAARLGCEVHASDLNPIACMLTWGAFHIVGGTDEERAGMESRQKALVQEVLKQIDDLGIDSDGAGWRAKAYLYCMEIKCPQTGWMVPLIPSRILSYGKRAIAELIPIPEQKRYDINVRSGVSVQELESASLGTVRSGGRGQDPYLAHTVNGVEYRTKISTLRGDYRDASGKTGNKLRPWEFSDFKPRPEDVFQERLYAVHWMRQKQGGKKFDYEFRSVTEEDLERERIVEEFVQANLSEWQKMGFIPDMMIEEGAKTDEPIRTRGWTYWHHLFPPRHLLLLGLIRKHGNDPHLLALFSRILNYAGKLCIWSTSKPGTSKAGEGGRTGGGSDNPVNVFYNQALNTLFNYGCRGSQPLLEMFDLTVQPSPCAGTLRVQCLPASNLDSPADIFITDPPYGDAVKYEEITEFFIAWLRKNPPKEFADWTWDSRRALAIKGEDDDFRLGMIRAYRRTAELMPDNGMQVVMFTHQDGNIWADMAKIIWASGLQVTAAWYVVTETDSALRQGANVKGTILLVLRKRQAAMSSFRDDLAWEIEAAVKEQIEGLTGLDRKVRDSGAEGLYTDADLQMAGYAAALKVLTAYSTIDGKDMVAEAEAPRVKGRVSFVEELIDFAVQTAVQFLVPLGFEKSEWQKLTAIERFYLKMAEMEAMGEKSLDNYQNFAKAFKVKNFDAVMSDRSKANHACLKLSTELKNSQMSGEGEMPGTPLRALLYALFELSKGVETDDVLNHLGQNHPNYLRDKKLLAKMADYLADKRAALKPAKTVTPDQEASHARILAEAIRNQKL